MQNNLELSL